MSGSAVTDGGSAVVGVVSVGVVSVGVIVGMAGADGVVVGKLWMEVMVF